MPCSEINAPMEYRLRVSIEDSSWSACETEQREGESEREGERERER